MSINEYGAYATKNNDDDSDDIQSVSQNSKCEAGEDNNNSCNNISISRQGGSGDGSNDERNDYSDKHSDTVQVSKQNSKCEAGEDNNNNSCNNFNIQNIIESKLRLISQTGQ